ncbi:MULTISPECIES: thioredoxin family protein [unclassified Sphingomonas]|uniref:thioredoxin family protein n=1 Tax=unclassified Sphingomonas TaxID=196159 RepID=UPI00226AB3F4|nr:MULTISPECIES: thioredoxin family protein [unclassified Sphingomonas]
MIRALTLGLAAAALAVSAADARTVAAPHVAAQNFEQLSKPLPLPYNEGANADAAVAAAKARALRGHKRLLIDLGGNWCLDCRLLAGTMELPELRAFVAKHYEVVTVDIGRFDKNGQVPAAYGITGRLKGVPAVLIVDPRTNRLVNAGHETALADARSLSPQALADWLAQWAA